MENYINFNKKEWEGILSISTEVVNDGFCITIAILKDSAPVDGIMMTFTKDTLKSDPLLDEFTWRKIRKDWGNETSAALDEAVCFINEAMHAHFLPDDKKPLTH